MRAVIRASSKAILLGSRMFKPGLEIFLVIHSLPNILCQEHWFHLFFNMMQFEREVMARLKTDLPLDERHSVFYKILSSVRFISAAGTLTTD